MKRLGNSLRKNIILLLTSLIFFGLPQNIENSSRNYEISRGKTNNIHFQNQTELNNKTNLEKSLLKENFQKKRIISASVGLDGVSEEYASKLIKEVSEDYKKQFNIQIRIKNIFNYFLPKKEWFVEEEMEKIKRKSDKKSEIYILLTNNDIKNASDSNDLYGESYPSKGYLWVETRYGFKIDKNLLDHEIGHLFSADDEYADRDSIMHKTNLMPKYWSQKSIDTILANKFNTWDNSE